MGIKVADLYEMSMPELHALTRALHALLKKHDGVRNAVTDQARETLRLVRLQIAAS